jgi:hypothetical protein
MLLAYLKLRLRNLGPILDASGWAINTRARVNVPFGASLTRLPVMPKGSTRSLKDPFAEKRHAGRDILLVLLFLVAGAAALYLTGKLDRFLPDNFKKNPPPATVLHL